MRPQLTARVMFYALFDVLGMIVFATGGAWFSAGKMLFIQDFPSSTFVAVLCMLAGFALMLWAAAQIVRELIKRPPES